MNKSICGSFNGTGAAVYLCLGFIPDFIQINSVEDADAEQALRAGIAEEEAEPYQEAPPAETTAAPVRKRKAKEGSE